MAKRRAGIDNYVVYRLLEGGIGEMATIKTCVGIGMSPNYAKLLVKRMRSLRLAQGKKS